MENDLYKKKKRKKDSDEVFFYNGCDNYIIREKYKNNILKSSQK